MHPSTRLGLLGQFNCITGVIKSAVACHSALYFLILRNYILDKIMNKSTWSHLCPLLGKKMYNVECALLDWFLGKSIKEKKKDPRLLKLRSAQTLFLIHLNKL